MSDIIDKSVVCNALLHAVYQTLLNPDQHAAFANRPARINRGVGGEFMACAGCIAGVDFELLRIVKPPRTGGRRAGVINISRR
jgi:hypothetical protein